MLAEQPLELQSAPQRYALNLFSASTPNALPKPTDRELENFPFFITQTDDAGRIRFHLHMGLFDSKEKAAEHLARIRAAYPWAWVSLLPVEFFEGRSAPFKVMGKTHPLLLQAAPQTSDSLESTGPVAPVVKPPEPPRKRRLHVSKILAVKKGGGATVSLESSKYAVQLLWSVMPVSIERARKLELFDEYILYVAQCEYEGRKWQALRLGFFSQTHSAMTIAKYLRGEFCSAALIPVTQEEKLQVSRLACEKTDDPLDPESVSLLLNKN